MSRCRTCNAIIEWAEIDGKKIPLDARAQTYEFNDTGDPSTAGWRRSRAMVSHFATCQGDQRGWDKGGSHGSS